MESALSRDFYSILGVARNASEKEIKERFRQLARDRHPDRFRGEEKVKAEKEFQDITEAFNVLTDPVRRRQVDLYLDGQKKAKHDPQDVVRVYLNRGIRAFKQKNYIEAASNFSRATDVDPKNAQAWHHLALTCSKEKRWTAKAQEAVQRALELRENHVPYLKLAGKIYEDAGMKSRAKQYYNQALRHGGSDPAVRKALRDLDGGSTEESAKSTGKSSQKEKSGLFGKLF